MIMATEFMGDYSGLTGQESTGLLLGARQAAVQSLESWKAIPASSYEGQWKHERVAHWLGVLRVALEALAARGVPTPSETADSETVDDDLDDDLVDQDDWDDQETGLPGVDAFDLLMDR